MVRRGRFSNKTDTNLNGAINNSVTSLTVDDASGYPSEGDFLISIDTEIMRVTSVSGNTLTVVRAEEGSTATSHSDNAEVGTILGRDLWRAYLRDAQLPYNYLDQPMKLLDDSGTILTSSDFTWFNQGVSSVIDQTWGGMTLDMDQTNLDEIRGLYKSSISTPYTLTGHVSKGTALRLDTFNPNRVGLFLRDSSTQRLQLLSLTYQGECGIYNYTDATTFSSTVAEITVGKKRETWMRISNDGVDLTHSISYDGFNWFEIGSEGVGTFLTPDQYGFFATNDVSGSGGVYMNLNSWLEE